LIARRHAGAQEAFRARRGSIAGRGATRPSSASGDEPGLATAQITSLRHGADL